MRRTDNELGELLNYISREKQVDGKPMDKN
jgi:hypothetical protein